MAINPDTSAYESVDLDKCRCQRSTYVLGPIRAEVTSGHEIPEFVSRNVECGWTKPLAHLASFAHVGGAAQTAVEEPDADTETTPAAPPRRMAA